MLAVLSAVRTLLVAALSTKAAGGERSQAETGRIEGHARGREVDLPVSLNTSFSESPFTG
jgi:hypothetical protein